MKPNELEDVKAFNRKFGLMLHHDGVPVHLTQRKLRERVDFMQEELDEFKDAMANQDMAGLADALVDLVYVAKGTALMLNIPWDKLWAEVQRANMAKMHGVTKREHRVDCVKPANWQPPAIERELALAGYTPARFCHAGTDIVAEELCYDDQP